MNFQSKIHTVEDALAAQEYFHSRKWTDGLPIIPPTADLVQSHLEWAMLNPDSLIGVEPVRSRPITAEKLAINAVMAGCLPMHFPLVVTAWTAMLQEEFLLHGATSSTGGCAILSVINGPTRKELGMDGTFNALGASDRATMVIGRAIRLALYNLMDVRPGEVDRSTLGHPGKISYCVAEDEENTGWLPLSVERGAPHSASAVTVMSAGSPRQLMNEWTTEPEQILETFVAEIKASMLHYSIWAGNFAIVVPPQLRAHFEKANWSKADIRQFVFERARVTRGDWASCGKGMVVDERGEEVFQALPTAEDLLVIAAGGPAGGFGAVIPPWFGWKSRAVTMAVGACVDCEA
ncbi:MAG: hypothetical protein VW620_12625 [Rhodospirillales bacterium]|jgi:hypothetical protein